MSKFCEGERRRMDKLEKLKLPPYFKNLGKAIVAIGFIGFLAIIVLKDEPSYIKYITERIFLVGLLFVALAREKVEDEFLISLRNKAYALAFVSAVVYALTVPYLAYGIDVLMGSDSPIVEDLDAFQLLIFMLIMQVTFYNGLKRLN